MTTIATTFGVCRHPTAAIPRPTPHNSQFAPLLLPRLLFLLSSSFFVEEANTVYWNCILEEMGVSFAKPPQLMLWLPGCFLNPAEMCLSLNSQRNLDSIAILWRDEGEGDMPVKKMILQGLRREVRLVAHALDALGFPRGSTIAVDMPMNVDSVIIYLAIVLTGNVVVSIADSFAPNEIATRLRIAKEKAIFTQAW